jgi:predicted SAM-dependent methyltransferase
MKKARKKLEIGGGVKNRKREGYIQMDTKELPIIDIVGDARGLPFKDGELDEIYGHWVLEHFYYREITPLLHEWKRALSQGGLIHMVTNNGEAHMQSYMKGEIDIHEFNRMLFGVDLDDPTKHTDIEDLHKIFWTQQLAHHFFDPIFPIVEIDTTWKHREDDGSLKCPAIIIKAWK